MLELKAIKVEELRVRNIEDFPSDYYKQQPVSEHAELNGVSKLEVYG